MNRGNAAPLFQESLYDVIVFRFMAKNENPFRAGPPFGAAVHHAAGPVHAEAPRHLLRVGPAQSGAVGRAGRPVARLLPRLSSVGALGAEDGTGALFRWLQCSAADDSGANSARP